MIRELYVHTIMEMTNENVYMHGHYSYLEAAKNTRYI